MRVTLETDLAYTLILDSPTPRTVRKQIYIFKPASLGYFVMAVQADQNRAPISQSLWKCRSLTYRIANQQTQIV